LSRYYSDNTCKKKALKGELVLRRGACAWVLSGRTHQEDAQLLKIPDSDEDDLVFALLQVSEGVLKGSRRGLEGV
jgi:hypothetical protein